MSGINDATTPSDYPENDWTRMIAAVSARNRGGGGALPEMGVPTTGTPMPNVRSADLGKPVPPPLSPQEMEELNRAALASGLVRGPVNAGIAQTIDEGDVGAYASMEDAIRAGAPVGADEDAVREGSLQFREPVPIVPELPVRAPIGGQRVPMPVAQPAAQVVTVSKLPDFGKVQMIDMVNGKVYVDGVTFDLTSDESRMLRKFCVRKAKESVQAILDAALKALEAADGDEAV